LPCLAEILSGPACRVLDECDEMLNMGFVDDVEKILNAGASSTGKGKVDKAAAAAEDAVAPGSNAAGEKLQTLLFSATMPSWVKDITRRFLVKGHKLVDLVGDDKLKVKRATSRPAAAAAARIFNCPKQGGHDAEPCWWLLRQGALSLRLLCCCVRCWL